MTPCQQANDRCLNEGTVRIRIAPAGDRVLCADHIALLDRMGAGYRRLDAEPTPMPAWRQRDLSRDESRAVA